MLHLRRNPRVDKRFADKRITETESCVAERHDGVKETTNDRLAGAMKHVGERDAEAADYLEQCIKFGAAPPIHTDKEEKALALLRAVTEGSYPAEDFWDTMENWGVVPREQHIEEDVFQEGLV